MALLRAYSHDIPNILPHLFPRLFTTRTYTINALSLTTTASVPPPLSASLPSPAPPTNPNPTPSAPSFLPFSPSFDQPTMSDYVNMFDWGLDPNEDIDNVDWTKLKEEVMSGPFGSLLDEGADAAEGLQPGDRIETSGECQQMQPSFGRPDVNPIGYNLPMQQTPATLANAGTSSQFVCDVEGCNSRPFKRRGDLARHSRNHGLQQRYSCPAQDCHRSGQRGFTRRDKLNDHMLAGHDEDTLFTCSACGLALTRDLIPLHVPYPYQQRAQNLDLLHNYQTCPMPRCGFRVLSRVLSKTKQCESVDFLLSHIREAHDLKGRANFANLLKQKGYDFQTCEIVCPICPHSVRLPSHEDFSEHFIRIHFHGPVCGYSEHLDGSCPEECCWRSSRFRLGECTFVPDEVRQHRRTILRILPDFEYYPVWEDIKCRGYAA